MLLAKTIVAATVVVTPILALGGGTQAFDQGMDPILQSYLKIHDALARDSTAGVQTAAHAIAKASKKLDAKGVTGAHAAHYQDLPTKLGNAAEELSAAADLNAARQTFHGLSKPMAMWATMSKPKGIVVLFCSMAKGSWLQRKGDIRNPYYGASMLGCGEIVGGDIGEATHPPGKSHGGTKHDKREKP